MPRDIAAVGTPEGTARLTFTPPAGTNYYVQFKKGTKAPVGAYGGTRVAEGAGRGSRSRWTCRG
ncbi:MAG: hypothetical protein H6528_06625 [Actinobacteria bacterium]|nr:hypothetical protein [Actinomycetota bacterium]